MARAQQDSLQILKTLEAQVAPDAAVSEMPEVQNPQNKRLMSEAAPHTSAQHHCVSQGSLLEEKPNAVWVFPVGTETKRIHSHCPYLQSCLQQINRRLQ